MSDSQRPGVRVSSLFLSAHEDVRLEEWAANILVQLDLPEGGEFLVLDGGFTEGGESFSTQSWLRLPAGSRLRAVTGPQGAKVWAKLAHLPYLPALTDPRFQTQRSAKD